MFITFQLLFRNQDIPQILKLLKSVDVKFLLMGVFCTGMFVACEGLNINRALKLFGYRPSVKNCIKYAAVGFFFSSITPSSTGGQPMQVCYMYKDDIKIAHSSLALLLELACFQFITVIFASSAYIYNFVFFRNMNGMIQFLIFFGIALNVIIFCLVLSSMFSRKISNFLLRVLKKIILRFKKKNPEKKIEAMEQQFNEYQKSAIYIKKNKFVIVKMCLTTFVQILSIHSIPFFVYLAMGQQGHGYLTVISLQAILHITVAALPLPGAVGASESAFMVLYRMLYSTELIGSALLLSRGISFYLLLIFCGMLLLVHYIMSIKKEKSYERNTSS